MRELIIYSIIIYNVFEIERAMSIERWLITVYQLFLTYPIYQILDEATSDAKLAGLIIIKSIFILNHLFDQVKRDNIQFGKSWIQTSVIIEASDDLK